MNTLDPAGRFGDCAVTRALAMAIMADTAMRHARMRLNIGHDPSVVGMELNEG
jgi:hypothetical protein